MEAQKPNTPQKPVAAKSKKTQGEHKVRGIKNAFLVILCCAVIAVCLYIFVFGDASHFDPQTGHPLPGDFLGTIYMGGVIVPVLQTLLLTVIVLSVERWIALHSAKGTGCKNCSNQILHSGINDLQTHFPEIAKQWDYDKNGKENSITVKGRYNTTSEELNLTEYYEDGTPNCRISAVKVPQGFRGTFTTTDGKEMDFFIAPDYSSND